MEIKKTSSNELGILHDRYELIKRIGSGYSSDVYIVKDLKDNNKEYALKLFKKTDDYENEVKINEMIAETKNSSFIKYITSSVGYLIRDGEKILTSYIIFELAKKGEIKKYINCNNTGLNERNCKIIFAKILAIVKALHKMGICHRDLKPENFLLDENFDIKLCDFGFSTKIPKDKNGKSQLIKGNFGTIQYAAPEIFENKEYNGEKIDIFSLGVILFNLRVQKFGFLSATIPKSPMKPIYNLYKYIKEKNNKLYWYILRNNINTNGLSEEFKNLYLKMVAYNPNERPTIEEIYNDEWMKEIRDLDEKEFEKYENELIKELKSREKIMNKQKNKVSNIHSF